MPGIVSNQSIHSDINELVTRSTSGSTKIDVLFINAGVASFAPFSAITEEHYDGIMNVDLKGALFTFQKFLPHLNDSASVIFLSSINSYNAMPNTAVYAASKAALNVVAKVAAVEAAPRKIRVNIVAPGPVDTPIWGKVGMDAGELEQVASLIQSKVPLNKFGASDEIATTVLFLASSESSFTTGAEFVVDGGFNLNTLVYLNKNSPKCIDCHMPRTRFGNMVRSDHSFRPPMPAASLKFKSPNACTICHSDKTDQWANQKVMNWKDHDYQKSTLYIGGLVAEARKGDWKRLDEMLSAIQSNRYGEVFTTSLIRLLANCDEAKKWPVLITATKLESPLSRSAAVLGLLG